MPQGHPFVLAPSWAQQLERQGQHAPQHSPGLCLLALLLPSYPNSPITYFLEIFLISPQWKMEHTFVSRVLCFDLTRLRGLQHGAWVCVMSLSVPQPTAPNSPALLMQMQNILPKRNPLTDAFSSQISSSSSSHSYFPCLWAF